MNTKKNVKYIRNDILYEKKQELRTQWLYIRIIIQITQHILEIPINFPVIGNSIGMIIDTFNNDILDMYNTLRYKNLSRIKSIIRRLIQNDKGIWNTNDVYILNGPSIFQSNFSLFIENNPSNGLAFINISENAKLLQYTKSSIENILSYYEKALEICILKMNNIHTFYKAYLLENGIDESDVCVIKCNDDSEEENIINIPNG
uniref:Uncharacterized protein n=1 Tax=viral metagenome TaxID=1070528 RepID=A0A6C0D0M5_9ZZZZ